MRKSKWHNNHYQAPHNPLAPPPKTTDPVVEPAPSPYPGGMASDPAAALANEIVTNIKGAYDRLRLEQAEPDLVGSVAISIRRFVDA